MVWSRLTPEGNYELTDDGKEALRVLETVGKAKGMMVKEISDADYMRGIPIKSTAYILLQLPPS